MFNNKKILITGGTGSFGKCLVNFLLNNFKQTNITIFSRDEMKQWEMANQLNNNSNVNFMIGDVRDFERVNEAFRGKDFIVHAAATKIVPIAEYNPFECIKTNINGAMNVIQAAINNNIDKVIALSTDKASNPINLYGATKLASDKLFVAANNHTNEYNTKFSIVRYGNVMGSRGSVIPFFIEQMKQNFITITDPRMTRFMISLEQAVDLVMFVFSDMLGGEIYVKKIPSMKITDIASTIAPGIEQKIIGIRPGEKLHEQMISLDDSISTFEYKTYYKILPMLNNIFMEKKWIKDGVKVSDDFQYLSNLNQDWMANGELRKWVENNLNHSGSRF